MKRNRLPFKRVFIMGLAGLRHKKFRLFISILLSVISFTIFGFSCVSATADVLTAELKTAYQNNVKMVILKGDSTYKSTTKTDNGHTEFDEGVYAKVLSSEQLKVAEKYSAIMPIANVNDPAKPPFGYGYLGRDLGEVTFEEFFNPYNYMSIGIANGLISRVIELDPETGEADALLTPDQRLTVACRLPQTYTEIAITDYMADMFMRFGYKDLDGNGTVYEIQSPDDLIGKTIEGLTICGIYETDEDKGWFKENYDKPCTDSHIEDFDPELINYYIQDSYILNWMKGEHSMKYAFVKKGFTIQDDSKPFYSNILYKLSGSIAKDKKIIREMMYEHEETYSNLGVITYQTVYYSASVRTRYSGFGETTAVNFMRRDTVLTVALWVSIGFALFSGLLLMNFLLVGLDARKQEIGILRAMGASRMDAARICLMESGIIAMINYIGSLLCIGGLCIGINASFHFALFTIGIIPFVALTALCFGVAALSTILPVIRITSQKPIDSINSY